MTEKIVELLKQMENEEFTPMPRKSGALKDFETDLGMRLPDDVRQVFTEWGGGVVVVSDLTPLGFGPIGNLQNALNDPFYNEYMPGMVIVGDTGGGYLYFYDPEDQLGRGPWHLYLVSMGDLRLKTARPVAASATEAVEKLLDGVEFMNAPEIGEDGEIY